MELETSTTPYRADLAQKSNSRPSTKYQVKLRIVIINHRGGYQQPLHTPASGFIPTFPITAVSHQVTELTFTTLSIAADTPACANRFLRTPQQGFFTGSRKSHHLLSSTCNSLTGVKILRRKTCIYFTFPMKDAHSTRSFFSSLWVSVVV